MDQTQRLIEFYNKGIEKHGVDFETNIISLASGASKLSEDERQLIIMEDMMREFDLAACKDLDNEYATDIIQGYDDDKLTDYQLNVIKKICKGVDVGEAIIKSCDIILEEGF